MNKETIYIEPENDITDIIAKIENAKEKIIALVPPKKAGVFRSVVNIKLIAKSAKNAEKTVVLVTVDPSIVKLAAASKLPVAKDLQSAPKVPVLDEHIEDTSSEDLPEEDENDEEETIDTTDNENPTNSTNQSSKKPQKNKDDEDEEEEDSDEEEPKKTEKKTKKGKKHRLINWVKSHKITSAIAGIGSLGLIVFLVWALFIAPAVNITVAIKTESHNFAENVDFTLNPSEENAKEGKFYLEEKKIESVQEIEFDATGQKNRGEKAHGEVLVYAYFLDSGKKVINQGAIFTVNGLNYVADQSVELYWEGGLANIGSCANKDNSASLAEYGCQKSATVRLTAAEGGTKYNIGASDKWSTAASVAVSSGNAMSGGTDDIITVVQQIDVENARNKLIETREDENKEKLYDSIDKDRYLIVEPSFTQETASPSATPAVDEEVKSGVRPVLKTTTVTKVYVIDKSKIKEYIENKIDLRDDQKIYDIRNPYFENLTPAKDGYTSRLKANYYIGPKITEGEIVDKIKGKGLGNAGREIRDIEGVSDVIIDKSFPWVMVVPNNSNKVEVRFDIKDQNGDKLEEEKPEEDQKEDENHSENQENN